MYARVFVTGSVEVACAFNIKFVMSEKWEDHQGLGEAHWECRVRAGKWNISGTRDTAGPFSRPTAGLSACVL